MLCELEAINASGRALIPSYNTSYNMQSKGDGGGKGGGKDSFGGKAPKGFGKGSAQGAGGQKPGDYKSQVCRSMRDDGTCSYGDACRYSHDKN